MNSTLKRQFPFLNLNFLKRFSSARTSITETLKAKRELHRRREQDKKRKEEAKDSEDFEELATGGWAISIAEAKASANPLDALIAAGTIIRIGAKEFVAEHRYVSHEFNNIIQNDIAKRSHLVSKIANDELIGPLADPDKELFRQQFAGPLPASAKQEFAAKCGLVECDGKHHLTLDSFNELARTHNDVKVEGSIPMTVFNETIQQTSLNRNNRPHAQVTGEKAIIKIPVHEHK